MMDRQMLCERYQAGERFNYLFFWGHSGTNVSKNCLSQWYPAGFDIEGIHYPTAEHYMMASKAMLFNDEAIYYKILETPDAPTVKVLGREVKDFDRLVWEANRLQIVVEGNLAKFSQHQALNDYLLGTQGKVLVEASPYDKVWGIGLAENDSYIENPLQWQGQNLLGFALMMVRDRLSRGN